MTGQSLQALIFKIYNPQLYLKTCGMWVFCQICCYYFYRRARKYAFISFDYQMIFHCYLVCRITAKTAVNIAQFAVNKVEVK